MYEGSNSVVSTAILAFSLDNLGVMQGSPLKAPTWWHTIRGKKKRTAKSEVRYIKLYRSSFFGIGQQPSNAALMYDTIYRSDATEGSTTGGGICRMSLLNKRVWLLQNVPALQKARVFVQSPFSTKGCGFCRISPFYKRAGRSQNFAFLQKSLTFVDSACSTKGCGFC